MSDGDLVRIPEDPDNPYPLGRHLWHDPRNREYRALERPPVTLPEPRKQPWWTRDVYDQIGPSCTAQAAVGVVRTSPFRELVSPHWSEYDEETDRHALYKEAQKHDPWPGENYDGSSTDAPFKVLRNRGVIAEWRWLFGLAEVREYLQFHGPVAVGTWWPRSWFYPDRNGVLHRVEADGNAGGHAYRFVYYDAKRKMYRKAGSWSRGWGQNGRAWVKEDELEWALAADGEAVAVVVA